MDLCLIKFYPSTYHRWRFGKIPFSSFLQTLSEVIIIKGIDGLIFLIDSKILTVPLILVKNVSLAYGTLKICVAAVSFFHKVFNFPCPVGSNSMINGYVEKFSRKPKVDRNPLLVEHMEAVFNYFDFDKCSLYHLRTIGFMVLVRISPLNHRLTLTEVFSSHSDHFQKTI